MLETLEQSLLYRAWSTAYCTHLSITYHPPLDRVSCLCSSVCHISFPLSSSQSCATVLKLPLDICQNALFQVTVQLFSSSCTDNLPCCLKHPHLADPELLISPCCYRIWFSVCPCVFKEVFSVCSGGGVPKMWCSGFTILASVMLFLSLSMNCNGFLWYCLVIALLSVYATTPIKITQCNRLS